MKSFFARFNLSPSRMEVFGMIMLGAIFIAGLVGAGLGVYTKMTSDSAQAATPPTAGDGTTPATTDDPSSAATTPTAAIAKPSPTRTTTHGPSGNPPLVEDATTTTTAPSTTTPTRPVRTVRISMVVHRGSGDFSDVPNQPFHGVCHPDGIRHYQEGGPALWEERSGVLKFDTPLLLTFEVPADQQVWCAFYLQPHTHWERATDVETIVNGTSHSGTSVECFMPVPGKSYKRTVEGLEYLPGRSDGCDAAYTVIH